jgi:hypothetical protein
MDLTSFERTIRRPEKVIVRHERARTLERIFELARVSIHDVVNDRAAKAAVLRLFRVADACAWESLRTALAARIERETWIRRNR